jgi:hypothetical protein
MTPAFLQRLFGQKKGASDEGSLSTRETVKSVFKREMPASDIADQRDTKPLESGPTAENIGARP